MAKQWYRLDRLQREEERAEGVHLRFGWVCVAVFTAVPQQPQFKLHPSSNKMIGVSGSGVGVAHSPVRSCAGLVCACTRA